MEANADSINNKHYAEGKERKKYPQTSVASKINSFISVFQESSSGEDLDIFWCYFASKTVFFGSAH